MNSPASPSPVQTPPPAPGSGDSPVVLQIDHLDTSFRTDKGRFHAVQGLSVEIRRGQTLGLVGESGSGKSVTSLSVMRLLPRDISKIEGRIAFLGKDLVSASAREMRELRGNELSMIFQEPGTSLNPVYKVGSQVAEAIRLHEDVTSDEAHERVIGLFREVGIPDPERRYHSYPHEMSGGQKQRVMIAMALSCNPQVLIADEPTTALDVTIQKQILDLIRKLRDQRGMAILFITHDLGVISEIANDVAVMYRGKLVEYGPVRQIFERPQHPYTKGLLSCRPRLDSTRKRLPTVADFMKTETDPATGEVRIVEKTISPERLREIESTGRGRLLHPKAELKRLGIAAPTRAGVEFVPDGTPPMLRIKDLQVYYPVYKGFFRREVDKVRAVDGVSFDVYRGQTLGLVGESGCGKTTTGRAVLRLLKITGGSIEFLGMPWSDMTGEALRRERRKLQIVFQDPFASLNPRMTVEGMLTEAMAVHGIGSGANDRRQRAAQLLVEVGLEPQHLARYPHQFSGGQRQRVCIARTLAVEPEFIVCDESVSALDVSVQAQVLNLLKDLQAKRGLTYIFISHDLSVVKFMSDMMAVMNAGKIVEFGPSDEIYANPVDPYTKKLIDSVPEVKFKSHV